MTSFGVSLLDGGPAPRPEYATLATALTRAAAASGAQGLCFVHTDGGETRWSYARLLDEAGRLVAGMRAAGVTPGDRVLVHVAHQPDLLATFWACVLGGFVPLPVGTGATPAARTAAPDLLDAVWNRYGRPYTVTGPDQHLAARTRAHPGWARSWLGHPHQLRATHPDHRRHPSRPDDLAVLLLTSGSTSTPKAVMLTHRNILSRSAATARANGLGATTRSVNWMPLDHAGGLLLFHVRDVFLGAHQVHARPERVLADPLRWLALAARHRACTTWAPNFALSLVNDQAHRLAGEDWDLRRLRYLMNGGEAVHASVVRRFMELLAPFGLPPDAMFPGWGMSETAAGVVDCRLSDLAPGHARYVPAGRPQPGTAVRCVDEQDEPVPAGTPGHLQVSGPSVTPGYLDDIEHTRRAFTADGWFRTGDLAFVQDGVLTVTGRADDLIERAGVRCHSHEIEAAVEELDFVAPAHTVACPVTGPEGEELAVFYHPRPGTGPERAAALIRAQVADRLGLHIGQVVPVRAQDVPRTGIGKLRRSRMRHWYETRHAGPAGGGPTPRPNSNHFDPRTAPVTRDARGAQPVMGRTP
ncbi:AMP-binding protein [Streptomyces europaeiscabiei]|uniref:AMP-binding protein n=1 Tax=Streptomyces TaxID=1883 RepID=UPI000A39EDB8|nr:MULTISPECIES: AMP-binding protein [Streptomyces]MDX3637608.1 AMP-binding protein [Streptomyces europaeiscabiei]MDX3652923.1 AMP-binding protein [Streptomyces europaeiscabiei]